MVSTDSQISHWAYQIFRKLLAIKRKRNSSSLTIFHKLNYISTSEQNNSRQGLISNNASSFRSLTHLWRRAGKRGQGVQLDPCQALSDRPSVTALQPRQAQEEEPEDRGERKKTLANEDKNIYSGVLNWPEIRRCCILRLENSFASKASNFHEVLIDMCQI